MKLRIEWLWVPVALVVACAAPQKSDEEPEVMMRKTLTDDDREIPAPRQRKPPAEGEEYPEDDNSVPVEMTVLQEGRTHIGPGGVQITVEKLVAGTPPTVRLAFRLDEKETDTEFKNRYAEGVVYGVLYKADVDGDDLTLRVEPSNIQAPIDVATAGEIAQRDFAERLQCEGVRLQAVGNTNGTVTIQVMRGEEEVVCSTIVGLYTRTIIE